MIIEHRKLTDLYTRMCDIDEEMNASSDVILRQELKEERDKLQSEIQRRVCVE